MYRFIFISFFAILLTETSFSQTTPVSDSTPGNPADKIFDRVEQEAEFPGGLTAWKIYLQTNLRADVPAKRKAPAGIYPVTVIFIVAKDGKISNVKAETNLGYGMEKEVIRIIKKSPNWVPAQQDGRPVNAYRRQPITFVVSEE